MPSKPTPHLRGQVEVRLLAEVRPNEWNPNRVPEHVMRSIEHGFAVDGWLVSQALLVWATDENGAERNIIIDGEHRWRAANNVGLEKGPMVRLEGLTETEAKALTVKLNQKRGDWDLEALGDLLREVQFELAEEPDLAMDLGFSDEELMQLLAEPAEEAEGQASTGAMPGGPPGVLTGTGNGVRTAQFFYGPEEHAELGKLVTAAAQKLGTKNPSDTVLAALRQVVGVQAQAAAALQAQQ